MQSDKQVIAIRSLAQERVDWRLMRDGDKRADAPLTSWLRFASERVNALVRVVLSRGWMSRKKHPYQAEEGT